MRHNALVLCAAALLAAGTMSSPAAADPPIPGPSSSAQPPKSSAAALANAFAGFQVAGSAAVSGGVLRLTSGRQWQAGAGWSSVPVDPRVAFKAEFDLLMTGPSVHADGTAFVVQADGPTAIGGHGGSMGYGGMTRSVALEFDTYRNAHDIDGNHIALVTGGRSDATQATATPSPVALFGRSVHVRITSDPQAGTLTVKLTTAGDAWSHVLSRDIDLASALRGVHAYVGLTAATGTSVSTQEVRGWSFSQ
jgi:hypothetical protein